MPFHRSRSISAFTLVELLVVIAIVAILSIVVTLVLNPFQLLAQSRDASRISDMSSLNTAVSLYQSDQMATAAYFVGAASTSYTSLPDKTLVGNATSTCSSLGLSSASMLYSYQCVSFQSLRDIDGTGWIPMNFNAINGGSPFSSLPADPVNQTSSNLYYTYATNGNNTYAITAFMESAKYAKNAASTGGIDPTLYSVGPGIASLPSMGRGLIGYWPMDEGQGVTTRDVSGSGNAGTVNGAAVWSAGQIGNALTFTGATTYVSSLGALNMGTTWTVLGWVKTISLGQMPMISNRGALGGSDYLGMVGGKLFYYGTCTPGSFSGPTSLNDGKYHQIGFEATPTSLAGYLDGTQNISLAVTGCVAQNFKIDIGWDPANITDFFNGTVDDVRIYNRALSAAEIQEIYSTEK